MAGTRRALMYNEILACTLIAGWKWKWRQVDGGSKEGIWHTCFPRLNIKGIVLSSLIIGICEVLGPCGIPPNALVPLTAQRHTGWYVNLPLKIASSVELNGRILGCWKDCREKNSGINVNRHLTVSVDSRAEGPVYVLHLSMTRSASTHSYLIYIVSLTIWHLNEWIFLLHTKFHPDLPCS